MLVKVFGRDVAAGCWCVCVCVSFRLLWGAQNARWCLLNSKALPLSTGAPQCGPHAVWNDQLQFRQPEFSNTQSYLLLRFSHRPFQPLFQVQHVVRNSRWMKVTARAREQISSARGGQCSSASTKMPAAVQTYRGTIWMRETRGQCVSTMLSGLWKSLGLFAPTDLKEAETDLELCHRLLSKLAVHVRSNQSPHVCLCLVLSCECVFTL